MGAWQPSLPGLCAPKPALLAADRATRVALGEESWFDYLPRFVEGHETVFAQLFQSTDWQGGRRRMYERIVEVPRLTACIPDDGPGHPIIPTIAEVLGRSYGATFDSHGLALYRDGNDSVAWHRDKGLRDRGDTVMATVSVGEPRPFRIRPFGGGASRQLRLGWGDLIVMGGAFQRDWEHAIPKVAVAGPRIVIMFRCRSDF